MAFRQIYRDSDVIIEQEVTGTGDSAVVTERVTYANAVKGSIIAKARAALTANSAFLAIASPTNAQVVAYQKLQARQLNALIRLALNAFDSDDA